MYIINSVNSGGVYAVNIKRNKKVVLIFEEEDDAKRYVGLLEAGGFDDELTVNDVDEELIKVNCESFGYEYAVIDKDHLVVPIDL